MFNAGKMSNLPKLIYEFNKFPRWLKKIGVAVCSETSLAKLFPVGQKSCRCLDEPWCVLVWS